jgi:hypothetical protein
MDRQVASGSIFKKPSNLNGLAQSRTYFLLLCLIGLLFSVTCKNPVSLDKIIILIDDYLIDGGRYVFYWNGLDDDKKPVAPGDYIVVFEIKGWQEQESVTAIKGGQANENNQARFEPGFWQYNELQRPFPNPFKVLSGVNISILLSGASRVKITIYKN